MKKIAKNVIDLREAWLQRATVAFRERFAAVGVHVPADVKVSCGWPGGGSPRRRIGECWSRGSSASKVNEVFLSPLCADPVIVADVLGHELLHAVDNCESGHGKTFTRNSKLAGYTGGKQSAAIGETLDWVKALCLKLGRYPHGQVTLPAKRKGAQHGLHKLACSCGNVAYMTQSKLAEYGPPACPVCEEVMEPVERQDKKVVTTV